MCGSFFLLVEVAFPHQLDHQNASHESLVKMRLSGGYNNVKLLEYELVGQVVQSPAEQQLFSGSQHVGPFSLQHAFCVTLPDCGSTWHNSPVPRGPTLRHSDSPPGKENASGLHGAHIMEKHRPVQYSSQLH